MTSEQAFKLRQIIEYYYELSQEKEESAKEELENYLEALWYDFERSVKDKS